MTTKSKTFVGFVADFSTDGNPDSPPGKELAEFINNELIKLAWNVSKPSNREGWAWEWTSTRDDVSISTIVGFVDDMEATPPRQWLITNEINTSMFKKVLGGKKLKLLGENIIGNYCNQLHNAISRSPNFSDILWHDAKTFDTKNDIPSSTP